MKFDLRHALTLGVAAAVLAVVGVPTLAQDKMSGNHMSSKMHSGKMMAKKSESAMTHKSTAKMSKGKTHTGTMKGKMAMGKMHKGAMKGKM